MRYYIQIKKKKSTSRFFGEKNFEKKIRSQYHNASEISPVTYIRTYVRTHTHTYRLFLKTVFLASWGLKTYLYAKKSKIKISPKTMVPLWGTNISIFWYVPYLLLKYFKNIFMYNYYLIKESILFSICFKNVKKLKMFIYLNKWAFLPVNTF